MSDAWARMFQEEADTLALLLQEEFTEDIMTTTEFIGPDGSILLHTHDSDVCECKECQAIRDERAERESRRQVVKD